MPLTPLILYTYLASPPGRASYLLLKAVNLPFETREINHNKREQYEERFLNINPQHTIPTLQDGDFVVWDSHAINAYLIDKYAENDSLYPKNLKKRAIINQRLHFDSGVLFPQILKATRAIKQKKTNFVTEEMATWYVDGYDFVEKFLKISKYAAGDDITIADFSFVTSLTTMNLLVPIDQEKYPLINEYLELCKSKFQGYEEINEVGLKVYTRDMKNANPEYVGPYGS